MQNVTANTKPNNSWMLDVLCTVRPFDSLMLVRLPCERNQSQQCTVSTDAGRITSTLQYCQPFHQNGGT